VEDGVRLEVLDWGGSGRPVVFLAGLGNTAHVFDDLADKLSVTTHVYGITRRGYGASSHPDVGYTERRLADDVLYVLDSLKLVAPILVGHSIAGNELTLLGARNSGRIAGLVYLDATADPTDDYTDYEKLRKDLPTALRTTRWPSPEDYKSLRAYRDWQIRELGVAFPEAEVRNEFSFKSDETMDTYKTPRSVNDAIRAGAEKREYSNIRSPILAICASPLSLYDQMQRYHPKTDYERAAIEAVRDADVNWNRRRLSNLQNAIAPVRIAELPGANHYVFLSNEADVLRELRAFLAGLPRP
jgi:pimeloyl-ACP methyl ester carboxylesterase